MLRRPHIGFTKIETELLFSSNFSSTPIDKELLKTAVKKTGDGYPRSFIHLKFNWPVLFRPSRQDAVPQQVPAPRSRVDGRLG